jgi:hypothetical protein
MPDMINPQKGIDLMNNKSIINRILFGVTIFQQYCPFQTSGVANRFSNNGVSIVKDEQSK